MGWISDRYMKTGSSLGAGSKTGKRAGVLQKITGITWVNAGSMEIAYEILECGHKGYPVESVGKDLFGPQSAKSRRCMLCKKDVNSEHEKTT